MFPHERSLVERHKDAPFVLLGVSVDENRSDLRDIEAREHLNWRNWWDGGGQIASQWKVKGFPTLFLIDHQGTIRHVYQGVPEEKELDHAIDKLLKEARK